MRFRYGAVRSRKKKGKKKTTAWYRCFTAFRDSCVPISTIDRASFYRVKNIGSIESWLESGIRATYLGREWKESSSFSFSNSTLRRRRNILIEKYNRLFFIYLRLDFYLIILICTKWLEKFDNGRVHQASDTSGDFSGIDRNLIIVFHVIRIVARKNIRTYFYFSIIKCWTKRIYIHVYLDLFNWYINIMMR